MAQNDARQAQMALNFYEYGIVNRSTHIMLLKSMEYNFWFFFGKPYDSNGTM